MSLLIHQARYDLLSLARDKRARAMTFAFPLILLVILCAISGDATSTVDGHELSLKAFLLPGIVTMSVLTASYGTLVGSAVSLRETGVFKRRRATPVPAATIVLARALATLGLCAGTTIVLLVVAQAAFSIGVSAAGLAITALMVVVAALAYSCLGYAASTVIGSVDAAQPAVQLTMLPLYFISGIWFSTDGLPQGLQKVAELLPVEPLSHALHVAALGRGLDLGDVGVLAVWAVAGAVVAARRFSWLPRAAAA